MSSGQDRGLAGHRGRTPVVDTGPDCFGERGSGVVGFMAHSTAATASASEDSKRCPYRSTPPSGAVKMKTDGFLAQAAPLERLYLIRREHEGPARLLRLRGTEERPARTPPLPHPLHAERRPLGHRREVPGWQSSGLALPETGAHQSIDDVHGVYGGDPPPCDARHQMPQADPRRPGRHPLARSQARRLRVHVVRRAPRGGLRRAPGAGWEGLRSEKNRNNQFQTDERGPPR